MSSSLRKDRASIALLLVLPALVLASCSRTPHRPKNVVLVSIDTLRADRMSLYGAARRTTPAIDALAAQGVHFTNAFSPSPWTLPAHAAMLTGRYPSSLSANGEDPLFRFAPLLSTILKGHGYRTIGVTGWGYLSKAYGADAGFDTFRFGKIDDAIGLVAAREKGIPFFLFFHTYVAHIPYKDRRYAGTLDGGQLATLYAGDGIGWMFEHRLITCGSLGITEAEKEFLLALYDGGVAAADEMVGRLLAALRDADVLDETMVVITSDHGEEFWDHTGRAAYHGHTLYNELLRVPLIWYEPGLAGSGGARPELVDLVDLVPTIVARLGFAVPPGLDGMDISPLLDGADWAVDRPLFAEAVRHGPPRQAVLSTSGKLIVTPDPGLQQGEGKRCAVPVAASQELYLPADPMEKENRLDQQPQLAATLAGDLERHRRAAAAPSPAAPRTPIDRATQERLRALGYLE